ncbi:MAG: DinB family protein [Acidobacteriota bacterium]
MTFEYLQDLLNYHYWARDRLLLAAEKLTPEQLSRDLGNSFPSVFATLLHIYQAEWIWYRRWQGESPSAFPADDASTLATLREAWLELEMQVRRFLAEVGPEGLQRVYDYRLLKGQPGSSAFWQMAVHVVNHASYHRGQVTTMLRQLGATPAQTMDLIAFFREKNA